MLFWPALQAGELSYGEEKHWPYLLLLKEPNSTDLRAFREKDKREYDASSDPHILRDYATLDENIKQSKNRLGKKMAPGGITLNLFQHNNKNGP